LAQVDQPEATPEQALQMEPFRKYPEAQDNATVLELHVTQ
jgi:hypothetical protein